MKMNPYFLFKIVYLFFFLHIDRCKPFPNCVTSELDRLHKVSRNIIAES